MIETKAKAYARLRDEQFSLFENYARQHGMNSKCLLVFMWIYYNQDGLTQETIAKRTFSTKQVVQAIIKKYMAEGMLELRPSQEDKRKKLVVLTEQGQTFASDLLDCLADYEQEAMAALTPEQQDILLEATKIFSHRLKSLLEKHEVEHD